MPYRQADREVIAQASGWRNIANRGRKIAVEPNLAPLHPSWGLPPHHLKKNPGGYCHVDVTDAEALDWIQQLIRVCDQILKAKLTAEQYQVTKKARRNVLSTMPMIRPLKRGSMWWFDWGVSSSWAKDKFALLWMHKFLSVLGCQHVSTITKIKATVWSDRSSFCSGNAHSAMSSQRWTKRPWRSSPLYQFWPLAL